MDTPKPKFTIAPQHIEAKGMITDKELIEQYRKDLYELGTVHNYPYEPLDILFKHIDSLQNELDKVVKEKANLYVVFAMMEAKIKEQLSKVTYQRERLMKVCNPVIEANTEIDRENLEFVYNKIQEEIRV